MVKSKMLVTKSDPVDPTEFRIFWLVPNNEYTVEVSGTWDYTKTVDADDLEPGEVFTLNLGLPI